MLFYQTRKNILGFFLGMKTLHHVHACNSFVYIGIQIRAFFPENLPALMGIFLNQPDGRRHQGNAAERSQRKPPVLHHHNHHHAADGDKIRKQRSHRIYQHVFQGVNVPDNPRQYFSGGTAVKKGKGQGLNMFIQFLPDIQKNLVGNLRHHIHPYLNHNNKNDIQSCCKNSQFCQAIHIPAGNIYVNRRFNHQRINQADPHGDHHTDYHSEYLKLIPNHIGKQPFQGFGFSDSL